LIEKSPPKENVFPRIGKEKPTTLKQGETDVSHVVTIKSSVTDVAAIRAACQRLGLAAPVQGRTVLFSGSVEGWAVQLPGWSYPAVCDTASGLVHFDNYQGRWGKNEELDRFLQAYAVERARMEARKKGYVCTEQTLTNGSIKLTIQVQGGAAV
jgi:hypothetical protein